MISTSSNKIDEIVAPMRSKPMFRCRPVCCRGAVMI